MILMITAESDSTSSSRYNILQANSVGTGFAFQLWRRLRMVSIWGWLLRAAGSNRCLKKGWPAEGPRLRPAKSQWALKKAGLQKAPGSGLRRVNGPWKRLACRRPQAPACEESAGLGKGCATTVPWKRLANRRPQAPACEESAGLGKGCATTVPWKRLANRRPQAPACEESAGLGKGCATTVPWKRLANRRPQAPACEESAGLGKGCATTVPWKRLANRRPQAPACEESAGLGKGWPAKGLGSGRWHNSFRHARYALWDVLWRVWSRCGCLEGRKSGWRLPKSLSWNNGLFVYWA